MSDEGLRALVPELRRNLEENIVPFWFPRCVDHENGGYIVSYGPRGEPKGPGVRAVVTQARMVWLFARLARQGYRRAEMLTAADHGFRYLRDVMWDQDHGGFVWSVDAAGRRLAPNKHLYGQAFALLALSEFARAAGRAEPLELALRLFDVIEEKCHDPRYGGYREYFLPDWTDSPADVPSYLDQRPGMKLMNTHLHVMEALTGLLRACGRPLVQRRLAELIDILSRRVVREGGAPCTDQHEADWTPIIHDRTLASYGHDLENVCLLADALDELDRPPAPHFRLFGDLWGYALRYGYDGTHGGFFHAGPLGQPASDRRKIAWVQAEALVSALSMYRWFGDARYRDVFVGTWRFVNRVQTDWVHGEWHDVVVDGRPEARDKAGPWKAAYHNGRAMVECLRLLSGMGSATSDGPFPKEGPAR